MIITCGNDIIDLRRGDYPWLNPALLSRIYHPHELAHTTDIQRAGTFAVKEAAIKALGTGVGSWLKLAVVRQKTGKPTLTVEGRSDIISLDCTISHDGDYLIATVVALLSDAAEPTKLTKNNNI